METGFFAIVASGIIEAVLSDIAQRPELDNIHAWLRGDRKRLERGVEVALSQAYDEFSKKYPDLSRSLFDRHFLQKPNVRNELKKLLVVGEQPDVGQLVSTWQQQFTSASTKGILPAFEFFIEQLELAVSKQADLQVLVAGAQRFEQLKLGRKHQERLEALEQVIQQYLATSNIQLSLTMPGRDPRPVLPEIITYRQALVDQLCQELSQVTWLAIVDGPGQGKTHLAQFLSDTCDYGNTRWISLRGRDGEVALRHLRQQVELWISQLAESSGYGGQFLEPDLLAELLCIVIEGDGLLVVDDLPNPRDNQLLFETLGVFVDTFAKFGMKLLTTSQWKVSNTLMLNLGAALSERSLPSFSNDEIHELLVKADAPKSLLTDGFVATIKSSTRDGHPLMVAATISWMCQHHWQLGADEVGDLLRNGNQITSADERERWSKTS